MIEEDNILALFSRRSCATSLKVLEQVDWFVLNFLYIIGDRPHAGRINECDELTNKDLDCFRRKSHAGTRGSTEYCTSL